MTTGAAGSDVDRPASIGQLVTSIKDDLTGLVRAEIELAKAELRDDVRTAAIGAAAVAVAGLFALLALILGSIALAYGVSALGPSLGWSFLIVTGAYLLIAVGLLLIAKVRFGRISGVERTTTTARDAARALRQSRRT